jgi:hypothetical protein
MAIDIYKQTAVHELGHVVIAYYFEYAVNYTSFAKAVPGEGETEIVWTPDNEVINILTVQILASERKRLLLMDQKQLYNLTNRFIMVMVAGTAAEIYCEKKESGSTTITNVNGLDSDFIDVFLQNLKAIGISYEKDLVQKSSEVVLGMFSKEIYWRAVDELSDRLLLKADHRLNRIEIEEYLLNAGLMNERGV